MKITFHNEHAASIDISINVRVVDMNDVVVAVTGWILNDQGGFGYEYIGITVVPPGMEIVLVCRGIILYGDKVIGNFCHGNVVSVIIL